MIEALTAYLLGMLLLAIPIMIIEGEDRGVRDTFLILLIYPLWLIPIILYFIVLVIYCFIFNKTIEEGYINLEVKINEFKIFIERLMKR